MQHEPGDYREFQQSTDARLRALDQKATSSVGELERRISELNVGHVRSQIADIEATIKAMGDGIARRFDSVERSVEQTRAAESKRAAILSSPTTCAKRFWKREVESSLDRKLQARQAFWFAKPVTISWEECG